MTFPTVVPVVNDTLTLDRVVESLTDVYRQAREQLQARLAIVFDDPGRFRERARLRAELAQIDALVANVNAEARYWLNTQYPHVYAFGANEAAALMGDQFGWTQAHRESLGILANDTYADLLHASEQMSTAAKAAVAEVAGATLRTGELRGRTARQLGKEIATNLKEQGVGSVVYANGRVVAIDTYAEMVARTKTALARNAGGLNLAASLGCAVFEIIDGNDCGLVTHSDGGIANGMIVDADTARQYPISHPNCRRSFAPRPDLTAQQARDQVERYPLDPGVDLSLRPAAQRADQAAFEKFLARQQQGRGLRKRVAARRAKQAARAVPKAAKVAKVRAPRQPRKTVAPPAPTTPITTPPGTGPMFPEISDEDLTNMLMSDPRFTSASRAAEGGVPGSVNEVEFLTDTATGERYVLKAATYFENEVQSELMASRLLDGTDLLHSTARAASAVDQRGAGRLLMRHAETNPEVDELVGVAGAHDWERWALDSPDATADYLQMSIFDEVVGNSDRHPGNFLLVRDTVGRDRVYPIDNSGIWRDLQIQPAGTAKHTYFDFVDDTVLPTAEIEATYYGTLNRLEGELARMRAEGYDTTWLDVWEGNIDVLRNQPYRFMDVRAWADPKR